MWRNPTKGAPPAPFVPQRRLSRGDSQCTGHAARFPAALLLLNARELSPCPVRLYADRGNSESSAAAGPLVAAAKQFAHGGRIAMFNRRSARDVGTACLSQASSATAEKEKRRGRAAFCSPRRRVFQAGFAPVARGTCAAGGASMTPARVPKLDGADFADYSDGSGAAGVIGAGGLVCPSGR